MIKYVHLLQCCNLLFKTIFIKLNELITESTTLTQLAPGLYNIQMYVYKNIHH